MIKFSMSFSCSNRWKFECHQVTPDVLEWNLADGGVLSPELTISPHKTGTQVYKAVDTLTHTLLTLQSNMHRPLGVF